MAITEDKIHNIVSEKEFIIFLRTELGWDLPDELEFEELTYQWDPTEIGLKEKDMRKSVISQLKPFYSDQPWGIMFIKLNQERLYTSELRKIIRALAPRKRRHKNFPTWKPKHLLFICTPDWKSYTFAHFNGEQPEKAKLSSFGWEFNSSYIRTVCEFNLTALKMPVCDMFGVVSPTQWIEDWEKAFDVEKVTKAFYKQFKEIFNYAKENIKGIKPIYNHDYTMLLFNRLLFLKFLEKKKWLNYNKTYLNDLYYKYKQTNNKSNFYSDYLYYLFFYALNNVGVTFKVSGNDTLNERLGIVPFLNGGLFEMDERLEETKAIISDKVFEKIFDFFGGYNFTVTENTPLDIEVAVDPEMLGKVFENLINSPEEEEKGKNRRKDTGSYYTPRIIVEYMCKSALKNFLQTEGINNESKDALEEFVEFGTSRLLKNPENILDKLRNIKILDPACGSGAFLVQMLHELVRLRSALFNSVKQDTATDYERKLEIITNNLYGTDIQNFACEISKLRFWLSLIVDYHKEFINREDFENGINDIPSLPNLTYKIRTGDSLLELIGGVAIDKKTMSELKRIPKLSQYFKDLEGIKSEHIKATGDRKNKLEKEIDSIENTLHSEVARMYKIKTTLRSESIFWEIDFPEVMITNGGFDITIGNPPYIRIHKQIKEHKEAIKKTYYSAKGDYDIYVLFIEKSIDLLKSNGVLAFITPDKYLVREYGENIRKIILKYTIVELYDISRATDIFDASVYPLITIVKKNNETDEVLAKICNSIKKINSDFKTIILDKVKLEKQNIIEIINVSDHVIIDKIFKDAKPLRDILFPNQLFCGTPRAKDYPIWKNYVSSKKGNNSLKMLVCSNLKTYQINHIKKVRTVGLTIISPYFHNRNNIVSSERWKDFAFKPKILIRGNDTKITAVLDTEGSVFVGVYAIKVMSNLKKSYKYLLAFLNSKLCQWVFGIQNPSLKIGGGFFSINAPQLLRLPYKPVNEEIGKRIDECVDKILDLKIKDIDNDINKWINKIDILIYKHFELTYDEIKIVDPDIEKVVSEEKYQ